MAQPPVSARLLACRVGAKLRCTLGARTSRNRALASALFAAALGGVVGCSRQATPPTTPAERSFIEVPAVVIRPYDEAPPAEKIDRAIALLSRGEARAAAELFDDVTRDPRAANVIAIVLYDAGIAWEQASDRDRALARFQSAMQQASPDAEEGKFAGLRVLRVLEYLERWSALSTTADVLLARPDLADSERLEVLGAKALSIVEVGDADSAEKFIAKGRDLVDALGLGQSGRLPRGATEIAFALGEMRRIRSERIRFVPLPTDFAAALEQRCQGLLDAQNAYTDTMRSFDPHWAAMSGFRIGELYDHLYRDLMEVAPPKAAETKEQKLLFQGAMRLRYRVLLDKGLKMVDHTLMLADKTGEASGWVERTREAKSRIERALREQQALIAALPYSEHDLERALQDLAKKKGGGGRL